MEKEREKVYKRWIKYINDKNPLVLNVVLLPINGFAAAA